MRILLSSHAFSPAVGGIETVSLLLAEEFVRKGLDVKVVTQTPCIGGAPFPFEVVRSPGHRQLVDLIRWCDICLHNNISLRTAWPLFFVWRPWIVVHQTWIQNSVGELGFIERFKKFTVRFSKSISISRAIAAKVDPLSEVIGNPYKDDIFRCVPGIKRDLDLIFVGRLVPDKGADLLLRALAKLNEVGLSPSLSIVGSGPEEGRLRELVGALDIGNQVVFRGLMQGEDLVQHLNRHRVLVVPSLWDEPFGIVALEGIACGCVVVASDGGGLRDAVGPCGVTFPNGDLDALVFALTGVLTDQSQVDQLRLGAGKHLAKYSRARVVERYISAMEELVK